MQLSSIQAQPMRLKKRMSPQPKYIIKHKHKQLSKEPKNKQQQKPYSNIATINANKVDKPFSKSPSKKMPPILPALLSINHLVGQIEQSTALRYNKQQMQHMPELRYQEQKEGLAQWKIGNLISKGSNGQVYKALNKKTGIIAAAKKITYLEKEQDVSKRELKVLCRMDHPYIIKYMQHYQVQNHTWIFMQYVPTTLIKFIRDYGPINYELYMKFAKQLIMALDYLYDQKIFHKDIKCSNVLVYGKGVLKLSDFGCAKRFDQSVSSTSTENYVKGCQSFKGSILWMAPQLITKSQCTRKTDIWGLGCTLLEMATGKPPWSEKKFDNQMAALWVIANEDETIQIPQYLDEDIKVLIKMCLKRNPEQRSKPSELLELPFFNNV